MLFDKIHPSPIRSARLDALAPDDSVLYSTVTSANGEFAVMVPADQTVQIRVWAKMEDTQQGQWQAKVVDNTHSDAVYALRSAAITPSESAPAIDIHAASNWGKDQYKVQRPSAPFAILDALYDGFTLLTQTEDQVLPELTVAWSPDNIAAEGAPEEGLIGSSYYTQIEGQPKIYLLGQTDNDADDYDRSVILHEFGHFIMDHISRSDSVGGRYGRDIALDLRVAFNEAISNVFATLIDEQPKYFDTYGNQQIMTQVFDLEKHTSGSGGWHSTEALSWLIHDSVDDQHDDGDHLSIGWAGLHEVLTAQETLEFAGATSIYSFLQTLLSLKPGETDAIHTLAERHNIHINDAYGTGETDSAGSDVTLPLHHTYSIGDTLQVCSHTQLADYNGADVHRLVRVELFSDGHYTITATKAPGGLQSANPNFVLYHQGRVKLAGMSTRKNREQVTHWLERGDYLLDIYEFSNADTISDNGGLACFDVSITPGDEQNALFSPSCDNLASMSGDSRCQFGVTVPDDSFSF